MECLLVVGESAQGDRWASGRRFDGAAAIQGVVICDSACLVFADDEGEDASFSAVLFGLEGDGNMGDRLD